MEKRFIKCNLLHGLILMVGHFVFSGFLLVVIYKGAFTIPLYAVICIFILIRLLNDLFHSVSPGYGVYYNLAEAAGFTFALNFFYSSSDEVLLFGAFVGMYIVSYIGTLFRVKRLKKLGYH